MNPTKKQLLEAIESHRSAMYWTHDPDGIFDIELYQAAGMLPADYDIEAAQIDHKVSLLLLVERLLKAYEEVYYPDLIAAPLKAPLEALAKQFNGPEVDEFDKLEALIHEQPGLFGPERRVRLWAALENLDAQDHVNAGVAE